MSGVNVGGFDVVVHLAEEAVNRGLELLPSGSTFPIRERDPITLTALNVPAGAVSRNVPLLYDAFVEIERPQVRLDAAAGTVTITCDLSPASQLTFLRTVNVADVALLGGIVPQIPLEGAVQLVCPFGVADVSAVWGGQAVLGRSAVADAAGINATFELSIPLATAGAVPLATTVVAPTLVTVPTAAVTTALQSAFGSAIGNAIGDLPLTTPVRLNAGPTPVQTVRDVVASLSPGPGGRPAVGLGVLTGIQPGSPGGPIPVAPAALTGAGAVISAANYWTLHLVTTAMRAAHPAMVFTIQQNPARALFQGAVVLPGGDEPVTLRRLEITVDPNGGLAVVGEATASGSCWDADIDFDFTFTFMCDPTTGAVLPAASPPNVDVDVDKDFLCQLLGAIVGAVSGFIVGAIIGSVVGGGPWGTLIGGLSGAVAGGIAGWVVAGALIDPLDLDGISLDSLSVLGGLTLPLPVGGAGLFVSGCDFDDLQVAGDIVWVDLAERHRSGAGALSPNAGWDLDSGTLRPGVASLADDIADLVWTGAALHTLPGSKIGPVFPTNSNAFGALSLTDLEGYSYARESITAAQIPVSIGIDLPWPLGDIDRTWLSFAVRTDAGRYAKCRVARDPFGVIDLEYVVYARPSSCLGSVVTLETLSTTVAETGIESCASVRSEPSRPSASVGLRPPRMISDGRAAQPPSVPVAYSRLGGLGQAGEILTGPDLVVSDGWRPPPCGPELTVEQHEEAWQLIDRAQRATVQALPTGVVAPLRYEWRVGATTLPAGGGTTVVDDLKVSYDENSPILTLETDESLDLVASILVTATDADGRQLRVSRHLDSPHSKRLGGCCDTPPVKLIPHDPRLLAGLEASLRIHRAATARLLGIAATGHVAEATERALSTVIRKALGDSAQKHARVGAGKPQGRGPLSKQAPR